MAHAKKGKLVRDRIPEIIRAHGMMPKTRKLSVKEYKAALREKLLEEAKEAVETADRDALIEELADLKEVIAALSLAQGINPAEVSMAARKKRTARGAFRNRIYLIDVKK